MANLEETFQDMAYTKYVLAISITERKEIPSIYWVNRCSLELFLCKSTPSSLALWFSCYMGSQRIKPLP